IHDVQIASVQTVESRVTKRKKIELPKANLVLVDEAHANMSASVRKILQTHIAEHGAVVLLYTATPVDMMARGELGKATNPQLLITAGTHTDMLACKAHLPAVMYGCDEVDLGKIGKKPTGEYDERGLAKAIFCPAIVGNVMQY